MNTTLILSIASLSFGLLMFLFAVLAMGTPALDIGLLSTASVFVLLGVVGLVLHRLRTAPA